MILKKMAQLNNALTKIGRTMTEQQEQQPVILTIDDQEYDVNELRE